MKTRRQQTITFITLLILMAFEIVIALQSISVLLKLSLVTIIVIAQLVLIALSFASLKVEKRFFLYSLVPVLLLLIALIVGLTPDSFREHDHQSYDHAIINSAR